MLTAYYAASAFLIIFLTTAFLHLAMVRNLDRSAGQALADQVGLIRSLLQDHSLDEAKIVRVVGLGREPGGTSPFSFRVLASSGRTAAETPGMAEFLPAKNFPTPDGQLAAGETQVDGRAVRLLAAPAGDEGRWLVQGALDRRHDDVLIPNSQRNARLTLAVAFVRCAAAGYAIARRGVQPIRTITETAESISANRLDHRLETAGLPAS